MLTKEELIQLLCQYDVPFAEEVKPFAYQSNENPDRQVWYVEGEYFVKVFSSADFKAYSLEKNVLMFLEKNVMPAPYILNFGDCGSDGTFLVVSPARGKLVYEIYEQCGLETYSKLANALGEWMGRCHVLDPRRCMEIKEFQDDNFMNHVGSRQQEVEAFNETLVRLSWHKILNHHTVRLFEEFFEALKPRLMASSIVLSHTDLHNENVFAAPVEGGGFSCMAIDFESAAIQPRELDLVQPFLSILGEGFPGRRLAMELSEGKHHPLLEAFSSGYQSNSCFTIDWDIVLCHSLIWYLSQGLKAHLRKDNKERDFYCYTALGATAVLGLESMDKLTE